MDEKKRGTAARDAEWRGLRVLYVRGAACMLHWPVYMYCVESGSWLRACAAPGGRALGTVRRPAGPWVARLRFGAVQESGACRSQPL